MSRVLLAVTFDADIRLAPKHRPDRVIALTNAKEWAGWRIEVRGDTVHVFSPNVPPREDADEVLRGGASSCETEIPRHRCVLSWAHPPGVKPAAEMTPAPKAGAVETHVVTAPPPPPIAPPVPVAQAKPAAPAPTPRRRALPPGAEPVMVPPPSRIDIAEGTEPTFGSSLVVE